MFLRQISPSLYLRLLTATYGSAWLVPSGGHGLLWVLALRCQGLLCLLSIRTIKIVCFGSAVLVITRLIWILGVTLSPRLATGNHEPSFAQSVNLTFQSAPPQDVANGITSDGRFVVSGS